MFDRNYSHQHYPGCNRVAPRCPNDTMHSAWSWFAFAAMLTITAYLLGCAALIGWMG